jgi:hypothetical protein
MLLVAGLAAWQRDKCDAGELNPWGQTVVPWPFLDKNSLLFAAVRGSTLVSPADLFECAKICVNRKSVVFPFVPLFRVVMVWIDLHVLINVRPHVL